MIPALFAFFLRSLRDDTRSRAMMWARTGMAVAVLFFMLSFSFTRRFGAAGRDFFEMVVAVNAVFIGIATLSYFAGAITEEKEEGTLGLLRMTELNPLAILLGKSTSRFCGGLLVLLVQFPFALLSVTLGGLRWEQVATSYAILAALMFFGANAGLLGSVLARRTPVAAILAGGIGFCFLAGGHCADEFFSNPFWGNWRQALPHFGSFVDLWQKAFIPEVLKDVLYDHTGVGWGTVTILLLLGGGCAAFLLAWLGFERFCVEKADAPRAHPVSWWRPILGFLSPRKAGRAWTGSRLEALVWKDYQFIHGGTRVAVVKVLVYLGFALWLLFDEFGYFHGDISGIRWTNYFATIGACAFAMLGAECAFAASRVFRLEKNARTLSGLAVLPHDLSDLISAKRRAVLLSLAPIGTFLVGAFVGAFVGACLVNAPITSLGAAEASFYVIVFLIWTAAQVVLNLRLITWFSLRTKWGGLPLALTCSYLINVVAIACLAMVMGEGAIAMVPIFTWVAAIGLKAPLHRSLNRAAAGE